MSYNNLLDFDAALAIVAEFEDLSAVVVKHNNPCGVAIDISISIALNRALESDPVSAFGGIVALNSSVNKYKNLRKTIIITYKKPPADWGLVVSC